MRYATIVLAGFVCSQAAAAQAVHGRVVTMDTAAVPAAIVTLLDGRGTPIARALADEHGRFNFRMRDAGAYRVEVQRIGYAAALGTPFTVGSDQVLAHTVVAAGDSLRLPARFAGEGNCTGADSGALGGRLWLEARKALLSTQLTRLTRAYQVDVELFVDRAPVDPSVPPTSERRDLSRINLRPLSAVSPAQLVASGYKTRAAAGDQYYAPDDEILLSDGFAATHCLRALPFDSAEGTVRLAFAPLAGRSQPDVRGILSFDRATLELRRVDFAYVNLGPSAAEGDHGGAVEFRRLPEGSWIIAYWSLAVPTVERNVVLQATPAVVGRRVVTPARPALLRSYGVRVTSGGGVRRVRLADEVVWASDEAPAPRDPVLIPPER